MTKRLEMPIPSRSRAETIWLYFLTTLLVVFSILAVFDLVTQDAVIVPVLWLGFVALVVWQGIEREGDSRKFAASVAGLFAGKGFIEIASPDGQHPEIRFGIQIWDWRSIQWSISFDKVVSVEWSPSQSPQYWHVSLWFKDDLKRKSWKPGEYVYVIEPSRRREDTEVFGLAFVDLLHRAGLPLKRGEGGARFVRGEPPVG